MSISQQAAFAAMVRQGQDEGYYPYFRPISRSWGPEVEVDGRRLIMASSNDYLGLAHDPRVVDAVAEAARRFGAGPGGSRFLCGNTVLHDRLEERLAAFVGKRGAVVHTTGFMCNTGALGCLAGPGSVMLCDAESHASLMDGAHGSPARPRMFAHNRADAAEARLLRARAMAPDASAVLVTEGVFSMSGDVAPLPDFVALKARHPGVRIYLDDAHGIGVMGRGGRGTADRYGLTGEMDFIMGTFSKALAGTGGFVATDDADVLIHLRHHSRTLIFSAALPAGNAAAVLASLEIIEREPSRVDRLHEVTARLRDGYRKIGLPVRDGETPVLPILVGEEFRAYHLSRELFDRGVFALPVVFPAVPRGRAILRTAAMSSYTDAHIDRLLETFASVAAAHPGAEDGGGAAAGEAAGPS